MKRLKIDMKRLKIFENIRQFFTPPAHLIEISSASHRGQADAGYLMLDAGYSNKKTRREIGHEGSKTRRKLDADCAGYAKSLATNEHE
jgi:hypothetical protein